MEMIWLKVFLDISFILIDPFCRCVALEMTLINDYVSHLYSALLRRIVWPLI